MVLVGLLMPKVAMVLWGRFPHSVEVQDLLPHSVEVQWPFPYSGKGRKEVGASRGSPTFPSILPWKKKEEWKNELQASAGPHHRQLLAPTPSSGIGSSDPRPQSQELGRSQRQLRSRLNPAVHCHHQDVPTQVSASHEAGLLPSSGYRDQPS